MSSAWIIVFVLVLANFVHVNAQEVKQERKLPHSYEVSIKFINRHFCAGAIVTPRHILTAAHCFYRAGMKYPESMFKYMSVVSGSNAYLSEGGKIHKIRNVTVQDDLTGPKDYWLSDIAVVTLESEIVYSALEQPIPLPDTPLNETQRAMTSIWMSAVDTLQTFDISMIPHTKCAERLKEKYLGEHDSKVCGYTRAGRGFCLNLDGSPLVQNGRIIGVGSASEGCVNSSPDVFTNVYKNLDFINRAIALNGKLTRK